MEAKADLLVSYQANRTCPTLYLLGYTSAHLGAYDEVIRYITEFRQCKPPMAKEYIDGAADLASWAIAAKHASSTIIRFIMSAPERGGRDVLADAAASDAERVERRQTGARDARVQQYEQAIEQLNAPSTLGGPEAMRDVLTARIKTEPTLPPVPAVPLPDGMR